MAVFTTCVSITPTPMEHITSMMKNFLTLPTVPYTDLIIQTEQASINLHSAILCSFSPMISSLLSPHPILPGLTPTSPHIFLPISVSKSSLPLARELLYTGYCVGTKEELKQVVEVLVLLEAMDLQLTIEEVAGLELENNLSEIEDEIEDGEQDAVQEKVDIVLEQQTLSADKYDEHDQFPAFLRDKFAKNHHQVRKSSSTPKTPLKRTRRRRPDTESHSFFCQHCHMKFSKLKDKELHALMEHSYELPFICLECGARFKIKKEVMQHVKNHTGGSFQIKCEVCDRVCSSMCQYHNHYKGHSDLREFGCNQCGKSFSTFNVLTKHEKIHQSLRFSCDECGKMFQSKDCIRNHHKRHHLDN